MKRGADATIPEIAYAEAVQALAEQHQSIDSVRTQAGLLLSSAAVTTSFLAGQAIHGGRVNLFAWLALVDFAAIAVLVITALQPHRWELSAFPDDPIGSDRVAEYGATAVELYETLTVRLRRSRSKNRDALEYLIVLLQVAGSLLAMEVVLWIAAIATAV